MATLVPRIPKSEYLADLTASRIQQAREAAVVARGLWGHVFAADPVEFRPETVAHALMATATAYAIAQRRSGHVDTASAIEAQVSELLNWQMNITSKVRTAQLVLEPEWPSVAFDAANRIRTPLRSEGVGIKLPGMHRHFLRRLNVAIGQPGVVDLIEAVEGNDTSPHGKSGAGLPGAIVGIATAERLIASHQLALLLRVAPLFLIDHEWQASALERNAITAVTNSGGPETWQELFKGYTSNVSSQMVPGLKESQFALNQYSGLFDRTVSKHYGRTSQWRGNFAALAWRASFKAFDLGRAIDAVDEPFAVMTALAKRELGPFAEMLEGPNPYFADDERDELREHWEEWRELKDSTKARLQAHGERVNARRREADSIEKSPQYQDMLKRNGEVFWDHERQLVVRIGGKSTRRVTFGSGDAVDALNLPAIEVMWFALSEDGRRAQVTTKPLSDDAGRQSIMANSLAEDIRTSKLEPLGRTREESLAIRFDKSVRDWLSGEQSTRLYLVRLGPAPPRNINAWAFNRNRWMYVFQGKGLVAVDAAFKAGHLDIELRGFRSVSRGDREEAVQTGQPVPTAPLDLWHEVVGNQFRTKGRINGSVETAHRVDITDAETDEVLPVRAVVGRGNESVPIEIAEYDVAKVWGQEQVGTLYMFGTRLWLISSLNADHNQVVMSARPYELQGAGGDSVAAKRTSGGVFDPVYTVYELSASDLWDEIDKPKCKRVGRVPPMGNHRYPEIISVTMDKLMHGSDSEDFLEVPEYLPLHTPERVPFNAPTLER